MLRGGAAGEVGECGRAELGRGGLSVEDAVDLGELVFGAGEADFESFDFAEPALAFGLGDAGVQVVANFVQPLPLRWVGS